MPIATGIKAPQFSLYNTERKLISSEDYKGKTLVMHFFPAAFTGVCTQQMCTSRDELGFYDELGVSVVGISVDMPFALKAFKQMHNINFELLSDSNKLTIHEYDMYHCNFILGIKGVAKRGVVVIGVDGHVAYSEETEHTSTQVDFDGLKAALGKLDTGV